MAVHLPRLLAKQAGASTVQAVAAGALIGPSQVERSNIPGSELDASASTRWCRPDCRSRCIPLGPRVLWRVRSGCGSGPIHHPARRGQWNVDHRARNRAARDLRSCRTTDTALDCWVRLRAWRPLQRHCCSGCSSTTMGWECWIFIGIEHCRARRPLHVTHQHGEFKVTRRLIVSGIGRSRPPSSDVFPAPGRDASLLAALLRPSISKIVRLVLCALLLELLKHLDRLGVMPAVEPFKALLVGNREPGKPPRLRVVHEYGRLQRKIGLGLLVLRARAALYERRPAISA